VNDKPVNHVDIGCYYSTAICPLGRDRTYRRYWVFRSIPGLFVEDDEQHVPDDCFQACEQLVSDATADENKAVNDKRDDDQVTVESEVVNSEDNQTSKDDTSAPAVVNVQEQISARNSVMWSLFVVPDHVEQLVAALNPRGIRESALKQIISDQSSQISDFISRCDVDAFCAGKPTLSLTAESENFVEQKMEKALREAMLDLEERIFTGNLGSMKVIIA